MHWDHADTFKSSRKTCNFMTTHGSMQSRAKETEMVEGKARKERKRKLTNLSDSPSVSLSLSVSHPQKLLVGDFPHELEVDEMEEDVPKRKNRTKARVTHS